MSKMKRIIISQKNNPKRNIQKKCCNTKLNKSKIQTGCKDKIKQRKNKIKSNETEKNNTMQKKK